jgi:hypothetical protein
MFKRGGLRPEPGNTPPNKKNNTFNRGGLRPTARASMAPNFTKYRCKHRSDKLDLWHRRAIRMTTPM